MSDNIVVLDLDDTLYLERDYVRSGFQAADAWAHENFGWLGFGNYCWALFQAGIRGNTFELAIARFSGHEDVRSVTSLIEIYRSHFPEITLEPDAKTFFSNASQSEVPIALLTGGLPSTQALKVQALGIQQAFECIRYSGQKGPSFDKPHQWAFREMQRVLGLASGNLTYIGDNPDRDLAGPLELGWRVIRIRRHGSIHEGKPSPTHVREIASLAAIADIF